MPLDLIYGQKIKLIPHLKAAEYVVVEFDPLSTITLSEVVCGATIDIAALDLLDMVRDGRATLERDGLTRLAHGGLSAPKHVRQMSKVTIKPVALPKAKRMRREVKDRLLADWVDFFREAGPTPRSSRRLSRFISENKVFAATQEGSWVPGVSTFLRALKVADGDLNPPRLGGKQCLRPKRK